MEQLCKIKFFSVQQRYRIIYYAMYDYISNSGIKARLIVSVYFFLSFKNKHLPFKFCRGSGKVVVPPRIEAVPLVLSHSGRL
jgi:hypothetical protein